MRFFSSRTDLTAPFITFMVMMTRIKMKPPPQKNGTSAGKSYAVACATTIEQYGLMARTVLQRWGIHSCEDFGRIVFALVDAELMLKTDEDTIDNFIDVYNFTDAFAPTLTLT